MTHQVVIRGTYERTVPVRFTTIAITDVVTAYDNTRLVTGMTIANETATARRADIHYYDGATDWLVWSESVGANSAINVPLLLRLYNGDKMKITAEAANALTVKPDVLIVDPKVGIQLADNFSIDT
jgi:hypothetical protein